MIKPGDKVSVKQPVLFGPYHIKPEYVGLVDRVEGNTASVMYVGVYEVFVRIDCDNLVVV